MNLSHRLILPLLTLLVTTASAQAPSTTELRDQRYCEVLLGSGGFITPTRLDVCNTIGLNQCPEALWSKLTVSAVKKETGAKFVKLNGPRHWVIDNFVNSQLVNPTLRTFGGIPMREAGVLNIHLSLMDNGPYQPHIVDRKTVEHFRADLPVYQLIDPAGEVFFMQSYSLEKRPQSLDTLPQLGSLLHLPSGWSFRSIVLKHDFYLKAIDEKATVIQDDFINTYQKSTAHAGDDF